jgi:nucleotide-binding universal stress UspA family protein
MEFNQILVPVTGQEIDASAIKLACSVAQKNVTQICAIYVIELKHNVSLDAEIEAEIRKAEAVLNHAYDLAIKENYQIETGLLQARETEAAIVDEAAERMSDLIVMSIAYKRRFGTFSMGDVVPYVLKRAPCPVMLVQETHSNK